MWNQLSVQMMEIHAQEMLHQAAAERLAREVDGLGNRGLHRQKRRWLWGLGRFLMVLGKRLQQCASAQSVSLEPAEVLGRE